jgi:hypothetical protein
MKTDEKQRVSNEIRYDIETGVYEQFPKLKERLSFIAGKLFESSHVINSSKELSMNELKTLSEQGYIKTDVASYYDDGDYY